MVEDGEITYEFFHEPGQAAVAPALDRLAFLLGPDGVKLERIGEASPVEAPAIPPVPLPLKLGEWNRLSLAVAGDRLKLTLNGVVVLERPIEPTNQRTFGLFHHADEGEARVRNVIVRGVWPKRKPADLGFGR